MARIDFATLVAGIAAAPDAGRSGDAAPAAAAAGPQDLAALRQILLGALPDEYAERMERLEERIADETAALHASLTALERRLARQIADSYGHSRSVQDELRKQLLTESKRVNDAIEQTASKSLAQIQRQLDSVAEGKLDRATFSSFLSSLARQLAHTPHSAGAPNGKADEDAR